MGRPMRRTSAASSSLIKVSEKAAFCRWSILLSAAGVDSLLNLDLLVCTFEEFSRAYSHTRLRILETALSGTTEALLEKKADVVISPATPMGFAGTLLRKITLIPVAAPTHPLVACGRQVTEAELRGHRQIVLRDSGNRRTQDSGWLQASKRWTVSHFSNSIKMIRAGLGFGLLPQNWIEQELTAGSLCRIDALPHMTRVVPIYLLLTNRQAAGPAAQALHDLLADSLREATLAPRGGAAGVHYGPSD